MQHGIRPVLKKLYFVRRVKHGTAIRIGETVPGRAMEMEMQEKLLRARITVIGAGTPGSGVLFNLACLGVGTVRIVDFDTVERSNENRSCGRIPASLSLRNESRSDRHVHSVGRIGKAGHRGQRRSCVGGGSAACPFGALDHSSVLCTESGFRLPSTAIAAHYMLLIGAVSSELARMMTGFAPLQSAGKVIAIDFHTYKYEQRMDFTVYAEGCPICSKMAH